MNCPNCGKNNQPESRFCVQCGAEVTPEVTETKQSVSGTKMPEDLLSKFVYKCAHCKNTVSTIIPYSTISEKVKILLPCWLVWSIFPSIISLMLAPLIEDHRELALGIFLVAWIFLIVFFIRFIPRMFQRKRANELKECYCIKCGSVSERNLSIKVMSMNKYNKIHSKMQTIPVRISNLISTLDRIFHGFNPFSVLGCIIFGAGCIISQMMEIPLNTDDSMINIWQEVLYSHSESLTVVSSIIMLICLGNVVCSMVVDLVYFRVVQYIGVAMNVIWLISMIFAKNELVNMIEEKYSDYLGTTVNVEAGINGSLILILLLNAVLSLGCMWLGRWYTVYKTNKFLQY